MSVKNVVKKNDISELTVDAGVRELNVFCFVVFFKEAPLLCGGDYDIWVYSLSDI